MMPWMSECIGGRAAYDQRLPRGPLSPLDPQAVLRYPRSCSEGRRLCQRLLRGHPERSRYTMTAKLRARCWTRRMSTRRGGQLTSMDRWSS